jgi:hypothetical protein
MTIHYIEMDQQRLNGFIVARGLLARGQLSVDGTAPGAISAVILFDTAVETAGKATLAARPPTNLSGTTGYVIPINQREVYLRQTHLKESMPWVFDQLLASYRELLEDEAAGWSELRPARRLHEYRNGVQHEGLVPSSEDLDQQRFRATDFLNSLAVNFFGRKLVDLSRATLIEDTDVRSDLVTAEHQLDNGDLKTAAEQIAIAFQRARNAFRQGRPKEPDAKSRSRTAIQDLERYFAAVKPRQSSIYNFGRLNNLEKLLNMLVARLDRVDDRLEALTLGAPASDYAWFQQRFPRALGPHPWADETVWEFYYPGNPRDPDEVRFSREEILRGLDFVTTVALHWQQFPPAPQAENGEEDDDLAT